MSLTLETCQAKWALDKHANKWSICDQNNNHLLFLPAAMEPKEVSDVMEFAKKFEREGFEYGKQTGSDAMKAANNHRIVEMTNKIMVLEHMNADLANKIEILIGNLEDA